MWMSVAMLVVLIVLVVSALVEWIWNSTVVKAATWARPITLWDGFKLILLCAILFGGAHVRFGH